MSKIRVFAVCSLLMGFGVAGCSQPDPNPTVRISGDKDSAVPQDVTSTTSTTIAPTTTLYYSSAPTSMAKASGSSTTASSSTPAKA